MSDEATPESPNTSRLRRIVMRTLFPAVLGGLIGTAYARYSLPPSYFENSSLPAMYATAGAAVMILAVRLSALLRIMLDNFRSKN